MLNVEQGNIRNCKSQPLHIWYTTAVHGSVLLDLISGLSHFYSQTWSIFQNFQSNAYFMEILPFFCLWPSFAFSFLDNTVLGYYWKIQALRYVLCTGCGKWLASLSFCSIPIASYTYRLYFLTIYSNNVYTCSGTVPSLTYT